MKKLLFTFALLLTTSYAFAEINVELSNEKSIERHSYNFGNVIVGMRVPVSYKVTNTGDNPLTFHSATIQGFGFDASHNCKAGLQPKATCSFTINYWPTMEGMSSGRFRINFDPESDIVVDLWGNAHR
jgi:hypothetical protein